MCFLKPSPQQRSAHDLLGYVRNTQNLWEQGLTEQPPARSHISRCGDAQMLLSQAPSPPQHPKPDHSFGKHICIHSSPPSQKTSPSPLTFREPLLSFLLHGRHPHTSPSLHAQAGWVQPFIFSPLGSQFSQICCSWLSSEDLLGLTCSSAPMGPAPWAPGPLADPAQLRSLG